MRDWSNENLHIPVSVFGGDNDRHRAILQAFFLPRIGFVRPQIGIGKNITRLRD